MVYYSRRQCSNPDDCADAQTPSPTVERVLNIVAPSSAPDDHRLLRAYIVLALNHTINARMIFFFIFIFFQFSTSFRICQKTR
jgi:hypothetical protein